MRKLTILVALAALVASSGGCAGCFGRVRNFFHRGSPCGTRVAPAVLGAPMAMGTPVAQGVPAPMMAAPMMTAPVAGPMVVSPGVCCDPCTPCVPCDPCDPCGGVAVGYGGECCDDGAVISAPAVSGTYVGPAPVTQGTVVPSPGGDQ